MIFLATELHCLVQIIRNFHGVIMTKSSNSQVIAEINLASKEGAIANLIADKLRGKLVYLKPKSPGLQESWYCYQANLGYWQQYDDDDVIGLITDILDKTAEQKGLPKGDYGSGKIAGIRNLLKPKLKVDTLSKESSNAYLNLQNGVLNLQTGLFSNHSPDFGFTYVLPYAYDPTADCLLVKEWLLECTQGDQLVVEVLRAYLNAILKGRVDLQRYVELIGSGGSGKSTYLRLAQALVGMENCFCTTLPDLQKNRFEMAAIIGKKLVVITDSDSFTGSVSNLKALTGEDMVRYEQKFKQQGSVGIIPSAMILIACNPPGIKSKDYSSGLQRRRLSIPLNNSVDDDKQRQLLSHKDGRWIGEFFDQLPGVLNWVLSMPDEDVTRFIKSTSKHVPSLALVQREALCNANLLAEWLDNNLVVDPAAKTYVGKGDMDVDTHLYPNYVHYCKGSSIQPVSLNDFSQLLLDTLQNQVGLKNVIKARSKSGVYVDNIRFRTDTDSNIPTPVTGAILDDPPKETSSERAMFSPDIPA